MEQSIQELTIRMEKVEQRLLVNTRELFRNTKQNIGLKEAVQELTASVRPGSSQQSHSEELPEDVPQITSQEQMDELEHSLSQRGTGDVDCYNILLRNISSKIPARRIHDGFMLLFDRHFAATCSWRGGGKHGPQVAFGNYKHIIAMFSRIGGVGREEAENILRKKVNNAKDRANRLGVRKSVARRPFTRKKDVNNNQDVPQQL